MLFCYGSSPGPVRQVAWSRVELQVWVGCIWRALCGHHVQVHRGWSTSPGVFTWVPTMAGQPTPAKVTSPLRNKGWIFGLIKKKRFARVGWQVNKPQEKYDDQIS